MQNFYYRSLLERITAIQMTLLFLPANTELFLLTKEKKEGSMYSKPLIICLMTVLGAMIAVHQPAGIAGEKEDLAPYYESCIVKKIEICKSQATMLQTSRSATLRKYARIQAQMAQYYDAEKKMLVNTMIQMGLEPMDYKIERFLDDQFYRSLAK